jgi:DNA-binding GntR family transcriptional regulator
MGDDLLPVIDAKTINTIVCDKLREAILKGVFKPGERLRQQDIAKKFGVSRIPVREALQRLEAEGLVKIQPYKGAVVAGLTIDDLREIFFLRALLEGTAAGLAAARMTAKAVDSISALLAQMEYLVRHNPDVHVLGDINARFHEAIYKQADSPKLYKMIKELWVSFPKSSLLFPSERASESLKEHQEIADALLSKDANRAETLMRAHIESVAKDEIEWAKHAGLDESGLTDGGDDPKTIL